VLRAILISAISLNLGLLLGRLSGFVREALVAANFGVSFEADVVVLMLTVPDLMVSILMGGAMSAVLVPAFSQSPEHARRLLYQVALLSGIFFSCISAVFIWQAQVLVSVLVPGFTSAQLQQAAGALDVVMWLIPLTVIASITTAFLHVQNKFIIASLGTLLVNSSIIVGLYLVVLGWVSMVILPIFVLLGGLIRLLSQVVSIRVSFQPISHLRPLLLDKSFFVRYGQAMFSGSLLFVFPVMARAFASFEAAGSVAMLNYSMRLIELPMAVCISFLGVVLFPRLSQTYGSDPELHRSYIRYGVQATLVLAVIAAAMLILLSSEYAGLVYGYGNMSTENVEQVARLISIGLLVLPLQGLSIYNTAVFYSRTDTRTPMIINAIGLLVFLILLKFRILGTGLEGIMWSLIASFGLILTMQWLKLKVDELKFTEVYLDRNFVSGFACALVLCLALGSWIATLQLHLLAKILLGMLAALACLLQMAMFYPQIRKNIKTRFSAD
jgi:murein biosynthesis integral membrane protein MurJ